MANNPLIPLAGRGVNVGSAFNNALLNIEGFESIRQRRAQAERDKAMAPLRQRQIEAQTTTAEQGVKSEQQVFDQEQLRILNSAGSFAKENIGLVTNNPKLAMENLGKRFAGLEAAGLDTTHTRRGLELIQKDPALYEQELQRISAAQDQMNALSRSPATFQKGSSFEVNTPEGPAITSNVFDPRSGKQRLETTLLGPGNRFVSPLGETPQQKTARTIEEARGRAAATAGVELKTQPEITTQVTTAAETAKLKTQKRFKPQIEAAVIKARKEAKSRGETLSELNQMQAALPGLKQATDSLKELALIATSTSLGRGFDVIVKELGFGATKGATARTKFTAIVNNQVLPLLKPTFGAAFTVQEGQELKRTMGDPDATPEEKIVQLNAFIDQKVRDIETKKLQSGTGIQLTTEEKAQLDSLRGTQ